MAPNTHLKTTSSTNTLVIKSLSPLNQRARLAREITRRRKSTRNTEKVQRDTMSVMTMMTSRQKLKAARNSVRKMTKRTRIKEHRPSVERMMIKKMIKRKRRSPEKTISRSPLLTMTSSMTLAEAVVAEIVEADAVYQEVAQEKEGDTTNFWTKMQDPNNMIKEAHQGEKT